MLTYADRDEGGRGLVDGRTQVKLYGMYLLYWAVFTKVFLSKFSPVKPINPHQAEVSESLIRRGGGPMAHRRKSSI